MKVIKSSSETHKMALEHKASKAEKIITISIGGATTVPTRSSQVVDFTGHVGKMLYLAKETRNRTV